MKLLKIEIELDNDVFKGRHEGDELHRILLQLAGRFQKNGEAYNGRIRDTNGNTIGEHYVSNGETGHLILDRALLPIKEFYMGDSDE